MIEQQYYTSSRRTRDGKSGFGILAQSPSMTAADSDRLKNLAQYGLPYLKHDPDPQSLPITLTFSCSSTKHCALSHVQYIGSDYTGRTGNFFAHGLTFPLAMLESLEYAPIQLFGSAFWSISGTEEIHDLPALIGFGEVEALPLADVSHFIAAEPNREERLAQMLQALILRRTSNRRLILVDAPAHIVLWIQALTLCLPKRLRHELTFSTYQRDPAAVDVALIATVTNGDFRFSPSEYQSQYAIFNFEEGRHSANIVPGPAAKRVSRALVENSDDLIAIDRLADDLCIRSLAEWEAMQPVYTVCAMGAPNAPIEALTEMDAFLRTVGPEGRAGAFEIAREFFRQVLNNEDESRLELPAALCHYLSQENAGMTSLASDCIDFLSDRLDGPEALKLLGLFLNLGTKIGWFTEIIEKQLPDALLIGLLQNPSVDEAALSRLFPIFEIRILSVPDDRKVPLLASLDAWCQTHRSCLAAERFATCAASASVSAAPELSIISARFTASAPEQLAALAALDLKILKLLLRTESDALTVAVVERFGERLSAANPHSEIVKQILAEAIKTIEHRVELIVNLLRRIRHASIAAVSAKELANRALYLNSELLMSLIADPDLSEILAACWGAAVQQRELAAFGGCLAYCFDKSGRDQEAADCLFKAIDALSEIGSFDSDYIRLTRDVPHLLQRNAALRSYHYIHRCAANPPSVVHHEVLATINQGLEVLNARRPYAMGEFANVEMTKRLTRAAAEINRATPPYSNYIESSIVFKELRIPDYFRIQVKDYLAYCRAAFTILSSNRVLPGAGTVVLKYLLRTGYEAQAISAFCDYLALYDPLQYDLRHTITRSIRDICSYRTDADSAAFAAQILLVWHPGPKDLFWNGMQAFFTNQQERRWWQQCKQEMERQIRASRGRGIPFFGRKV